MFSDREIRVLVDVCVCVCVCIRYHMGSNPVNWRTPEKFWFIHSLRTILYIQQLRAYLTTQLNTDCLSNPDFGVDSTSCHGLSSRNDACNGQSVTDQKNKKYVLRNVMYLWNLKIKKKIIIKNYTKLIVLLFNS